MHSHAVFGRELCPWLREPYELLESSHRQGRLAHGWLFTGPSGIGKINLALAMAERLLNPSAPVPGELSAANAAAPMAERHEASNHHPDLQWVFPEARKRSISVDQIRETSESLTLTSLRAEAKVVVLDPADALTNSASDAFLKTLEEPSADTYLFLVSHRPGRLAATIRSRCQTLSLPRPRFEQSLAWLEASPDGPSRAAWTELLTLADGAPFRALTLYEQEYHNKNNIFEDKFQQISKNELDPQTVADEWLKEGLELPLSWLAMRLQRVIRARMAPEASNPITDLRPDRLHNAWQALTLEGLFHRLEAAETLLNQLGRGTNAELALRVLLLAFHPQRGRS